MEGRNSLEATRDDRNFLDSPSRQDVTANVALAVRRFRLKLLRRAPIGRSPFAHSPPYQSNPADLLHRVQQNFLQLLVYRKPVAADFDGAKNVRPTWMPLTGRFPIHQHFGEIEKRHAIDTI